MDKIHLDLSAAESHDDVDLEYLKQTLLKTVDGEGNGDFYLFNGENMLESLRKTNEKLRSILANISLQKNRE